MSDTVTRLVVDDREFVLVGTAHISRDSVDEVDRIIREERPDRVCVEIDAARYKSLAEDSRWSSLDISQVLRENKGFLLLGNLVLASFQRRLGLDLGIKPGEEMLKAIAVANELGIPSSFCDREIQTTLKRAWSRSSLWGRSKMLAALVGSILSPDKLSAEEVEALKKKSALDGMLDELAGYMPRVKEVLIDERDQYLAKRIHDSEGARVLAVVGAGHVPGILRWLKDLAKDTDAVDTDALDQVPSGGAASRLLPWLIPGLLLLLLGAGFLRSGWQEGLSMVGWWVLANGGLAALGSAIALAHPVTIIASVFAAPVATLNPAIGVGMLTGLIEVFFRKPRVDDFERLHDDIMSVRGFFKNRITHVLLVFLLSNLGGMIGNFIALPYLGAALR